MHTILFTVVVHRYHTTGTKALLVHIGFAVPGTTTGVVKSVPQVWRKLESANSRGAKRYPISRNDNYDYDKHDDNDYTLL